MTVWYPCWVKAKVSPTQFSVWRRSDIRQAHGVTRRPERPEVKALEGREDAEPLRSGQLGGRTNRRAAAKANGSDAEIGSRTKLIQADISEMPRVSFLYSMASADAEELRSTHRVSRRKLKAAILDSTAVKVR